MTFRFPSRSGSGLPRRTRRLLPILIVIAALVVVGAIFTNAWTDVLWYKSVGYSSVYTTRLFTQVGLFVVTALVMAGVVGVNILLAYRARPAYRPLSAEQQGLERYRSSLQPHHRKILLGVCLVVGLIAGGSVTGEWQTWLKFANGVPFGTEDAQFGKDVSFFTFVYPFLRLVLNLLFAIAIVAFVASAFTHYLYGGLRLQAPGERVSTAARVHLSVLLGLLVLFKAADYWLDRFGLAFSERGVVQGPSYTDVNAVLPAKMILIAIAVICALLFFANIVVRSLMLPGVAFGLLVLSAILIGGVWPAVVQQFQVEPNESAKEAPYIKRNIQATRTAYGIDDVKVKEYNARSNLSREDVGKNGEPPSGVRQLDPSVVAATFQQLQQIRGFYSFNDVLDVDRYTVNGEKKVLLVAAREMKRPPEGQRNWVNSHLVYTHGYGFVAAPTNAVDKEGKPQFVAKNMPPQGKLLGKYQPRIYFGEQLPAYSIVDTGTKEFDYPDSSQGGQRNNAYQGSGGVPIGSLFHRMLYALQFQDRNILLSSAIDDQSQLMYVRQPKERVRKVAPFLHLDGNVYPVVVNNRIKWVVDGYTTSSRYPYSQRTNLAQSTQDANTATSQAVSAQEGQVNYIRNSVKAVVDAYSGEVTLYQWNKKDPILKTWMNAFPDLVKPKSAIPGQLKNHLRYPVDLFKVQRNIFGKYHVQDPQAFYGGQDFWRVPNDPTRKKAGNQPPYYLSLTQPGADKPVFSLTTTYVPRKRANLAAFMSVNSEPGKNYGQLRVLRLPRSRTVAGPAQVQNQFDSNPTVAQQLNLLSKGDSQVVRGNLLTLPVSGGLVYIEPIYVQSSGREAYPVLRRVLVSYGSKVGFAPTVGEALNEVFGTASQQGQPPDEQPDQPEGDQPASNQELAQALEEAQQHYEAAQEALRNSNFQKYGQEQKKLGEALERAASIREELQQGQS